MGVTYRFWFPALIFIFALDVSNLQAFSLGPIEVKSSFGDRFNAEIPVSMEGNGKIKVRIGNAEDYQKIGLERLKIVDELEVQSPNEEQKSNKSIHIISNRPLFYPSFNLVVRAELNEGVILENYLVAVDFQQNVSLAIKGQKTSETEPPAHSKSVDAEPDKVMSDVSLLPSAKENIERKTESAPVKGGGESKSPVAKKEQPAAPTSASHGKTYGPILPGQTLWKISEQVAAGSASAVRMTVALWRANKDKFFGGNIHGLKIGEVLNLENLDKHLEGLTQNGAMDIVQSQLREWRQMLMSKQPEAINPDLSKVTEEGIISPDIAPGPEQINALLEEWKRSWEAGNLDQHMALFSKSNTVFSFPLMMGIKKRMFSRHKNVRIGLEPPSIIQKKGLTLVVFEQHFQSDQMETFGQKTIELSREGAELKIVGERFVPTKEIKRVKESQVTPPERGSAISNPQAEILSALEGWRKSWESGDLDSHMAYFSAQPVVDANNHKTVPAIVFRAVKKPMFSHYKNVKIRLGPVDIRQKGEGWAVSCEQTFHSDALKSRGRKYFEFIREGDGWKIITEEFKQTR